MGGGLSSLIPTDGLFGGGAWTQIVNGTTSSGSIENASGIPGLTFTADTLSGGNGGSGNWSISWTGSGTVDLIFSMHGGGTSGFWDFNDLTLPSSTTFNGTWLIDFLNNGQQTPGESNWQVWVRTDNSGSGSGSSVPEPSAIALLGVGLLGLGFLRRLKAV
jgi:hypothetical protein